MTLPQATEILTQHQRWRRDWHVPSKFPITDPTELGEAIDVILEHLINSTNENNKNSSHSRDIQKLSRCQ